MKNRDLRKEVTAKHQDPLNFTCGVCKQVHKFKDNRYLCDLKENDS